MAESIGNSGTGMKLHTKILIALLVGATAGILANTQLGGASPTVVWLNKYIAGPVGQIFLRLLFMVVMNTIGAFQMFAQAFILTGGGPEMTTRGVVSLIYDTAFADYRLGYGAAISWLLFLIIAIVSLIQYGIIRKVAD